MRDWEKLKVVELKEELKSRNVSLTGLKLKQQLIDKLIEVELAEDERIEAEPNSQANGCNDSKETEVSGRGSENGDSLFTIGRLSSEAKNNDNALQEMPAILKNEESRVSETATPPPIRAKDASDAEEIYVDDPFIPEANSVSPQNLGNYDKEATIVEGNPHNTYEAATVPSVSKSEISDQSESSRISAPAPTTATNAEESSDMLETIETTMSDIGDQRKRKRRSASPPIDEEEMAQKKAKVNDGTPVPRRESKALEKIMEATHAAELSRQPNDSVADEPLQPMEASADAQKTRVAKDVGSLPDAPELQDPPVDEQALQVVNNDSHSQDSNSDITPAKHPATSSIYIKNFKRPLHIHTLRSHIAALSRAPDQSPTENTIREFFLDSIRTHAFVSFISISAASRVRNAMHEKRFPDEAMREPLWVDFIPDDKVKTWIDEETSKNPRGSGGSRGGNLKYEVLYTTEETGIEARLQEVSALAPPTLSQSEYVGKKDADVAVLSGSRTGSHPERAPLIHRERQSRAPQNVKKSDAGAGFRALDELFSSTVTKPKLYFKLPSQHIIDDRLDMIRGLMVGHTEMGRSGDQGMKRYTFEDYNGREEWVDRGPEFGFGKKGQDRLVGVRGRGGYRGGRRGGDSWRGR